MVSKVPEGSQGGGRCNASQWKIYFLAFHFLLITKVKHTVVKLSSILFHGIINTSTRKILGRGMPLEKATHVINMSAAVNVLISGLWNWSFEPMCLSFREAITTVRWLPCFYGSWVIKKWNIWWTACIALRKWSKYIKKKKKPEFKTIRCVRQSPCHSFCWIHTGSERMHLKGKTTRKINIIISTKLKQGYLASAIYILVNMHVSMWFSRHITPAFSFLHWGSITSLCSYRNFIVLSPFHSAKLLETSLPVFILTFLLNHLFSGHNIYRLVLVGSNRSSFPVV